MAKVLFWTSRKTAQAHCYDEAEFAQALQEAGLTPSPLPNTPVKVNLPSGLILHARTERIGGAMDEEGSSRVVVTIAPRELW